MTEREQQALKIVKRYVWWSMGAGLIPIHYVDLAALGGVQLKMLAELSSLYGVPFQENTGKIAIASLGGAIVPHAATCGTVGSILKHVPLIGQLAGGPAMVVFSAGYTWGLGNVFVQHFESGGTFLTFDSQKVKDHFHTKVEEGGAVAASMAEATGAGVPA